jgi:hypothetical protein
MHEHQLLPPERDRREVGGYRQLDDAEVRPPVPHAVDDLVRGVDDIEGHADLLLRHEPGDRRRPELAGLPRDRAHPQRLVRADGREPVDVGEDPPGDGDHFAALPRDGDAAALALEDRDTDLALERTDGPAESGLGDVQRGRGPGHRALVRRGDEVAELVDVHRPPGRADRAGSPPGLMPAGYPFAPEPDLDLTLSVHS